MNKPAEGVLTEPYETTPIEVEQDNSPFVIVYLFVAVGFGLCIVLGAAAVWMWL